MIYEGLSFSITLVTENLVVFALASVCRNMAPSHKHHEHGNMQMLQMLGQQP